MKTTEIRNMTRDELSSKQLSIKEELLNLRFQSKMGKLEKPSRIRQLKRDIARISTVLNEGSYARGKDEEKKA